MEIDCKRYMMDPGPSLSTSASISEGGRNSEHIKSTKVDDLGHHLLHHQNEPVIFSNAISDWPAASWTPESLKSTLTNHPMTFRIGTKQTSEVEWEADCDFMKATMEQFVSWLEGGATEPSHPLNRYDPDTRWCYCDYKHIPKEFPDKPELLKAVDWSSFGFPGRAGAESTLWLGSVGAHTQCHYDTYGCNLVAQIYGRKRWVLFPPSQTELLYPSRVPYEESSVFSKVNVPNPDLHQHPRFRETSPTVVTLEPGDVLYVPRHWWHDVTSLSTSISVNTWLELPCDSEERIKEAVTRTVIMAMVNQKDENITCLNQNEEYTDYEENMNYLQKALVLNKKPSDVHDKKYRKDLDEPCAKRQCRSPKAEECPCNLGYRKVDLSQEVKRLTPCDFSQYQTLTNCRFVNPESSGAVKDKVCRSGSPTSSGLECDSPSSSYESVSPTSERERLSSVLLECLTHPDVIQTVYGLLHSKLTTTE